MSKERGAVLVETAIIISLLLLLLFAVVEIGRYVAVWHGVSTAAREGARYGVATGNSPNGEPRYRDCLEIEAAAVALSGLADLEPDDVTVRYDLAGNPTCESDPSDIPAGTRVIVTVSHEFEPITPLAGPFLGSITVTAEDSRTIFQGPAS